MTKLAGLLIKTLAKPLSKRIKHEFSRYEFTQRILVGIGQSSHRFTSRLTIWSAGYQVRSIKDLEAEKAMVVGAEFVGETFLLLVSGGLVLYEYNNSNEKARIKDEQYKAQIQAERDDLQAKLHAIDVRLKALEIVVKNNSNSILNLGQHKYVPPNDEELVPLDHFPKEVGSANGNAEKGGKNPAKTSTSKYLFLRTEGSSQSAVENPTRSALETSEKDVDESKVDQDRSSPNTTDPSWWKRIWPLW